RPGRRNTSSFGRFPDGFRVARGHRATLSQAVPEENLPSGDPRFQFPHVCHVLLSVCPGRKKIFLERYAVSVPRVRA
ncbi:hypothetical protein KI387_024869, partial [Taxus chinensis]